MLTKLGCYTGRAGKGYAGEAHHEDGESGQNYRSGRAAQGTQRYRYQMDVAAARNLYDEADSGAEKVDYRWNALENRLGERCLPEKDARHKMDRIYLSEMIEAEGPPGPPCFGPRIMKEEPPVRNFQLPREKRTYDGTTKPEDWLADYVNTVYAAGGGANRRWALRWIPTMLVGPTKTWLNNLPAGSIEVDRL
jgi:hypothetical protein